MWHRYYLNALAALQYSSYLLVGALYFWVFGAMAHSVGNSLVELGAVFVPLVLGGFASALSLITPRVAAGVAMTCSVPYLVLGIPGLLRGVTPASPLIVITSALVICVSVVAFFWSDGSVWRRLTTTFGKVALIALAALPALLTIWWFGAALARLISSLHGAT
jgi:hypothetical protein